MKEADLNHDLVHLFQQQGIFAHKLPDPNQATVLHSAKRPFDGFARFYPPVNDFWFESKLIKNNLQAFDLSRVQKHQLESLKKIRLAGGHAAVILGFWIPRKEYWFMVFDINFICRQLMLGKKSITKKELLILCKRGFNISLKNSDLIQFKPEMLLSKMIVLEGDLCG